MRDLAVLVPSFCRPDSIKRLRRAMDATCRGDTALIVGLNEDDPARDQYPEGVHYEIRSGLRFAVEWFNELAVPAADEYRFIGALGDDFLPGTEGWDARMMEALGRTPFAFGNDLYPREPGSLPCHIFTRSEVVKALGYLGPPCFRHTWVDVAWQQWGRACGITYLHDVIIEHLHFTNGKAPVDASYAASSALMPDDEAAYKAYCADPQGLAADIGKIAGVALCRR